MSAEADEAVADMTHEEALAALPKLREEASRANARVHEAMSRRGRYEGQRGSRCGATLIRSKEVH